MNSFFNELSRRKVTRVALLYAGLSWLLIQVAETVLPIFGVSNQILRWMIILLSVGFVVTVVLSWLYDITPDGVRRDDPNAAPSELGGTSGRGFNMAIALVLVLATGAYFAGRSGYFSGSADLEPATKQASVTVPSAEPSNTHTSLVSGVAVLPFENLSDAAENAFFATGVHDEILTNLSSIRNFRVISRTSVRGYADTRMRVPEIARQLGVSHIMEGSVRRSLDKVRVTVLLIDAVKDEPIWSESYDRTLLDILDIQSEIAKNIVSNIKGELSDDESLSIGVRSTSNTRAYELYLKARAVQRSNVRSSELLEEPLALIELALEKDPMFVEAWVEKVRICGGMVWWDDRGKIPCARQALAQVTTLAPGTPQQSLAQGIYDYRVERNFASALATLQSITDALPNAVNLWEFVGYSARRLARWDVALDAMRKVILLSPQDASAQDDFIITLAAAGNWPDAIKAAESAEEKFPNNRLLSFITADLKRKYQGDLTHYASTLAQIPPELRWVQGNIWIEGAFPSQAARMAWLEEGLRSGYGHPARLDAEQGTYHLIGGRPEQAAKHFARAYPQGLEIAGDNWENEGPFILALVSLAAANAGDVPTARRALARFAQFTEEFPDQMMESSRTFIVDAYAMLGDTDRAWQEVETLMELPFGVTSWDLTQDVAMRHWFSDHPGYQALVEQNQP